MPTRNLMVTGTRPPDSASAARTAAPTTARRRVRFTGRAAPPPLRVTLGAGQPKFMSTWSTRSSATSRRTISPTVTGSVP